MLGLMSCSICDQPVDSRGLCRAHYRRWRRHGDPLGGGRGHRPKGLSVEESFRWFMPGDPPIEGCWDWTASTASHGYGQFSITVDGKLRVLRAHRVSHEIFIGPIPAGLDVLHSCDRPVCVQPAHLRAGTATENTQDSRERNRMALGSRNGHAKLTEADVIWIRQSSLTNSAIAQLYQLDPSNISHIRRGKKWKHLL